MSDSPLKPCLQHNKTLRWNIQDWCGCFIVAVYGVLGKLFTHTHTHARTHAHTHTHTYTCFCRFVLSGKGTIGNERLLKITSNSTINLSFLTAISILVISNHGSSECCLIKLRPSILFGKLFISQHWKWPPQRTSTVPIISAHFRFLWCPVAGKPGKVTVGRALHCTRPQRFIHLRAHGLRKEDEHRTQECP